MTLVAVVDYSSIRPQIRSGDLLAWRRATPFAQLIRHWTGGSYSHVGIAWRFRGRLFVLQDKEKQGIDLVALSDNLPCDWIRTDAAWTDEVEIEAMAHLGQSYSLLNCVLAGLNIKPIGVRRICSEYAYGILRAAGVMRSSSLSHHKDLYAKPVLNPSQLVNLLLDLGKTLATVSNLA